MYHSFDMVNFPVEKDNVMKKTIFVSIMFLSFVLCFTGCSKNSSKKAPLQQDMTLTYSEITEDDTGKQIHETLTFDFEKIGDNTTPIAYCNI